MKKYIIPIIIFVILISYIGYKEWCYRHEDTYIKLDVIASTSDLRILADEEKNIYLDTGKGLVPYFKDGKKVNLNDYKEVESEKEKY